MDSKTVGELVATSIIDDIDALEAVDDETCEWHDAIATSQLDDVEYIVVDDDEPVDAETPLELKAARVRVSEGSGWRDGLFYLREGQQQHLLDNNGVYVFSVYELDKLDDDGVDDIEVRVRSLLAMRAERVDELITSWYNAGRRREPYTQIRWSRLPFERELVTNSVAIANRDIERQTER